MGGKTEQRTSGRKLKELGLIRPVDRDVSDSTHDERFPVGRVIEEFRRRRSLSELGSFAEALAIDLAKDILQKHNIPSGTHVSYYSIEWVRLDRRIRSHLGKRRFIGEVGNESAVIASPESFLFRDKARQPNVEDMRAFIGAIDLFSEGRGNIGSFTYGVAIALNDSRLGRDFMQPDFSVRFKPISHKAINGLIEESNAVWAANAKNALLHPFSGGLPGLGRR